MDDAEPAARGRDTIVPERRRRRIRAGVAAGADAAGDVRHLYALHQE